MSARANALGAGNRGKYGPGRARQDKILKAAAELFRTRGFARTGLSDIGAAVGITAPGIYRHFSSKQHLLAAIMQQALGRYRQIVETVVAEDGSPAGMLQRLVGETVEACVEDPNVAIVYLEELQHLTPQDRARLGRVQRSILEEWARIVQAARGDLSAEEARLAVLAVGGLMAAFLRRGVGPDPARSCRLLTEMVMGALAARRPVGRVSRARRTP